MGEAAVKVALACGYVNAGTVEMLFQDGEFWFLEMNTRLQVEHCVTEEVSGLDLVAEQLSIASGKKLSLTQKKVRLSGHAIECRINAENPAKKFLPSPGPITRLRVPSGPGVRWDGGYEEGDEISQYYDNLVGKLVVHAADRDRAIARMLRALRELEISGIKTTVPADIVLVGHPDFAAVEHSTKWVEDELDASLFAEADTAPVGAPAGDGEEKAALVERTLPVEVDGKRFTVKVWVDDAPVAAPVRSAGAGRARAKAPARSAGSGGVGGGTVSAPMQGTIVQVLIAVGDSVEAGQALLVLEAMKMENHINAEIAGTVKELRVATGDTVGAGDVLVIVE
jgi:acetyl-CoA/propionyl-CoA carboxylase biotin carboxyl carrier protein